MDIKKNSNNSTKEIKFNRFINKTIAMCSKQYYKKQSSIKENEEYFSSEDSLYELLESIASSTDFNPDNKLYLDNAISTLSVIEQAVIFLLFNEQLSQDEAGKILEICSKSVSRIKLRAIKKLKKYLGDDENG